MVTNLKVPSLFDRQKSQCSIEDNAADTRAKALQCSKGVDSLEWLPRMPILRLSHKAEIHKTYTWLNWEACVLPLLGWVFPLSCLSASYIPIYPPFVFHLYSPLPISLICSPSICCSLSHIMDTIHIVPSVEAISERHLETSVNLPIQPNLT